MMNDSHVKTGLDAYETFLLTLGEKDRRNIRKHLATCEAMPTQQHAVLWKRLACSLAALGGTWAKTTGMRAVQFFVADGNYRIQTFALEDTGDGIISIYARDALDAARTAGIVVVPVGTSDHSLAYEVGDLPGLTVRVEVLSASKTVDAPEYYRHLLGWNRKALRIILPTNAGRAQLAACDALCGLSVRQAAQDASTASPQAEKVTV
jgi:hypothetical protein